METLNWTDGKHIHVRCVILDEETDRIYVIVVSNLWATA